MEQQQEKNQIAHLDVRIPQSLKVQFKTITSQQNSSMQKVMKEFIEDYVEKNSL